MTGRSSILCCSTLENASLFAAKSIDWSVKQASLRCWSISLLSMRDGADAVAFLISSGVAVTIPLSRFDANSKEVGESEKHKTKDGGEML